MRLTFVNKIPCIDKVAHMNKIITCVNKILSWHDMTHGRFYLFMGPSCTNVYKQDNMYNQGISCEQDFNLDKQDNLC